MESLRIHLEGQNWQEAIEALQRVRKPEAVEAVSLTAHHLARVAKEGQAGPNFLVGSNPRTRLLSFMLKKLDQPALLNSENTARLGLVLSEIGLSTRDEGVISDTMGLVQRLRTSRHYANGYKGQFNLRMAFDVLGLLHRLKEHSAKLFGVQRKQLGHLITHVETEIERRRYRQFKMPKST